MWLKADRGKGLRQLHHSTVSSLDVFEHRGKWYVGTQVPSIPRMAGEMGSFRLSEGLSTEVEARGLMLDLQGRIDSARRGSDWWGQE